MPSRLGRPAVNNMATPSITCDQLITRLQTSLDLARVPFKLMGEDIERYRTFSPDTYVKSLAKVLANDDDTTALILTLSGIVVHGESLLGTPRFGDPFMPSSVGFNHYRMCKTLRRLSLCASHLALPVAADRFRSWANFYRYYPTANGLRQRILAAITAQPNLVINLLIDAEKRFQLRPKPHRPTPTAIHADELTKEEVASAVSLIVSLLDRSVGLELLPLEPANPHADISQLMLDGHWLRQILEAEVSVFRFGYSCRWDLESFTVAPTDPKIGMAIELGYMRTNTKYANPTFRNSHPENMVDFWQYCSDIYEKFGPVIFEKTTDPERVRLMFPDILAQAIGKQYLAEQTLFVDDWLELSAVCNELFIDAERLLKFAVHRTLTLGDVLRISRIIRLIANLYQLRLAGEDITPECAWRSAIGAIPRESFFKLIVNFGFNRTQVEHYLELFSWTSGKRFTDLQYQSLLIIQDYVLLPYCIHSYSNLLRNSMVISGNRIDHDGSINKMSNYITRQLEPPVEFATSLKYKFEGAKGEIDVLAHCGDTLYVLELKDTLLPCNAFERRTLWDYLSNAAAQLDRLNSLWTNNAFRVYLAKRASLDLASISHLQTGIVLSVRMFSGINFMGHPVRSAHETANLFSSGNSHLILFNGKTIPIDLWPNASPDQIWERYFADENPIYDPFWYAAKEHQELLGIQPYLRVKRYIFNQLKVAEWYITNGFLKEQHWVEALLST